MTGNTPFSYSASLITMFVVSFGLVILFAGILQQIGAPILYISLLMMIFVVGLYVFSGLFGKTMRFSTFQTTDKQSNPVITGMMIASGMLSGTVFLLEPGNAYSNGTDFLVMFLGMLVGIAFLTILFSAKIARSKSATLTTLLFPARSPKPVIAITAFIVMVCSFSLLVAQLKLIGIFMQNFYSIEPLLGMMMLVAVSTVCLIMGGMQSLGIARMLAYPAIAIAIFVPLIWTSYNITGNPVPQLAFGDGALGPVLEIDREMLSAGIAAENDIFNPLEEGRQLTGFNYLAALFSVVFAFAAMPHLLQHFTTLGKGREGRKAGVWAFLFVAVVLTAIPAIAVFAKLDLYTTLLGLQLGDLESEVPWVFDLSGNQNIPLIMICGSLISSSTEAIAACGQSREYFLSLSDITINPDYLMLSFPLLSNLPELITVILVTGALVTIFTTVDGLILVMANTMTADVYKRLIRQKSPPGIQLFMNRFFIMLFAVLAVLATHYAVYSAEHFFTAAIALTAASLFPLTVCRIWMSETKSFEMGMSVLAAFVFTGSLLIMTIAGADFIPNNGDEISLQIPGIVNQIQPMSIGILGAAVFFVVLAFVRFVEVMLKNLKKRDTANASA